MNPPFAAKMCSVLAACLFAAATHAAVITSNNLATQDLGGLTATTSQVYTPFSVTPGLLTGTTVTVYSTKTGASSENISTRNYSITGVSQYSDPTTAQLSAIYAPFIQGGAAFNPSHTASRLIFTPSTGATALNYHLGVGDTVKYTPGIGPWDWQADNITVYTPALDDAGLLGAGYRGNLVPNASFENSAINFFSKGTVTADASAPQGGNALRLTNDTSETYIGVPVSPGKTYVYSIWVIRATAAGDVQIEWGLSPLSIGGGVAAGNSSVWANGLPWQSWREMTGTFTPGAGQTTWYFGGYASGTGNYVQFDSVLVQQIPEPATLALAGFAMSAILVCRRW